MIGSCRRSVWLGLVVLSAVLVSASPTIAPAEATGASAEEAEARAIFEATGVRGGLIVHLGCGDGRLTAALGAGERYLVHGLDADPGDVARAREHVRSLGRYGTISVDRQNGRSLPYVDNLVNLLVAEQLGEVPVDEVTRVLCPGGVAYLKEGGTWTKTIKPRPREIDEWTHSLYDASNNAVGQDRVVGPPHHVQWVGEPRSARQHERLASVSAVVSSGGRVFSIQDEGPIASIMLPPEWFLVGRDAFNGVILWKRPVGLWEGDLRPFRSGPPDVSRRLVAVGDRVYVTLGYAEPACALDAATGEKLITYAGTEGTSEILYEGGVLYLVTGDFDAQKTAEAARRRGAIPPSRNRRILAIRAQTGDLCWQKSDADTVDLMPATLAVSRGRVFFQSPEEIVCLEAGTGQQAWRALRPVSVERPDFSAPTLVVYGDVVLSADRAAPGEVEKEPARVHPTNWVDAPRGELIAFSARAIAR